MVLAYEASAEYGRSLLKKSLASGAFTLRRLGRGRFVLYRTKHPRLAERSVWQARMPLSALPGIPTKAAVPVATHRVLSFRTNGKMVAEKSMFANERGHALREFYKHFGALYGRRVPFAAPMRIEVEKRGRKVGAKIATEFVPGRRSINSVNFGRMPEEQRGSLIEEAGKEIGLMHRKGVFHGDLHAGNVLYRKMPDGRPKVYFIDSEHTRLHAEGVLPYETLADLRKFVRDSFTFGLLRNSAELNSFLAAYKRSNPAGDIAMLRKELADEKPLTNSELLFQSAYARLGVQPEWFRNRGE